MAIVLAASILVYLRYGPGGDGAEYGHVHHRECGIPLQAIVDIVDPEFGFTREQVERALSQAAALWQVHSQRPLFVADEPRRRMPVDLVYDERQVLSNTMRQRELVLKREERSLEELRDRYMDLQRQLAADDTAYRQAAEQYRERAAEHERLVHEWNAGRGDRSPGVESRLRAVAETLRTERERLQGERNRLDARIAANHHMAGDVQRELEAFNRRVAAFNETTEAAPITAGGYTYNRRNGRRITIYRANDYDELVLVIAHELGHALGIGHVPEREAIMHEEINAVRVPVHSLTAADAGALHAVCGP